MLLITCLAIFTVTQINTKQPVESEIQKTWAWFMSAYMGTELVSEKNESLIRSIQQEMGMDDWQITILQYNSWHTNLYGPDNACAIGLGINRIYINQDTFEKLSLNEKKALIRHELAHIKKRHGYKKWLLKGSIFFLTLYALDPFTEKIQNEYQLDQFNWTIQTSKNVLASLIALIITIPLSRFCEREADTVAAEDRQAALGSVDRYSKLINTTISPCWLSKWFSTHPTDEERLSFFKKEVAKHQKALN